MDDKPELLPCPFPLCAGNADLHESTKGRWSCKIVCGSCFTSMPGSQAGQGISRQHVRSELTKAWNTRPDHEADNAALRKQAEENNYHYLTACEQRDSLNFKLERLKNPSDKMIQAAEPYLRSESETNIWAAVNAMIKVAFIEESE